MTDRLGKPERVEPSSLIAGADFWFYSDGKTACEFTISNGSVADRACSKTLASFQEDENRRSRRNAAWRMVLYGAGVLLQGVGQAMSNSQTISCTTSTYGNTSYTNCR